MSSHRGWTAEEIASLRRQIAEGIHYDDMTGCGPRKPATLLRYAVVKGMHTPELERMHQERRIRQWWGERTPGDIGNALSIKAEEVKAIAADLGLDPFPETNRSYTTAWFSRTEKPVAFPAETREWALANNGKDAEATWIVRMLVHQIGSRADA